MVHRDIKPHNIIVTDDGDVKVTDFGIARATNATSFTEAGVVMGTVAYFSPEQAKGRDIGPHSDIYALGVVMYEMLTGRVPFRGDSAIAVALQHIQDQPRSPSRINPSIPKPLERLVLRALAKDPRARYPSAQAMLEDLKCIEPPDEYYDGRTKRMGQVLTVDQDEEGVSRGTHTDCRSWPRSEMDKFVRRSLRERWLRSSKREGSPIRRRVCLWPDPVTPDKCLQKEVNGSPYLTIMLIFLAVGFMAAYASGAFGGPRSRHTTSLGGIARTQSGLRPHGLKIEDQQEQRPIELISLASEPLSGMVLKRATASVDVEQWNQAHQRPQCDKHDQAGCRGDLERDGVVRC